MNAQKLELKSFSKVYTRLQNAIVTNKPSFALSIGDKEWQCKLIYDEQILSSAFACVIELNVAGHKCNCYLESLAPLVLPPLETKHIAFLPAELLDIIMENSINGVLQNLSNILNVNCSLVTFSTLAPDFRVNTLQNFSFVLEEQNVHRASNDSLARGVITDLPQALLEILDETFINYNQDDNSNNELHLSPLLDNTRINIEVIWQTRALPFDDIEQLDVGDCLLMPSQTEHIAVKLDLGQKMLSARLNFFTKELTLENHMQEDVQESLELENNDDTLNENQLPSEELLTHPKHCPIPVQCKLGSVSLSLEDISKLSSGMILGPMDNLDAPVSICVGNTQIGRGSLVDIEGRVGVQITEIFKS